MGLKARHALCLALMACLIPVAVTHAERTVQTGLRVVESGGGYVLFSDVIAVGGNVYIGGCSGSFSNHVWTLWRLSADGSLTYSAWGRGCVTSLASDGSRIYAAGVLEHDEPPRLTGFLAAISIDLGVLWEREWVGSPLFSYFGGVAAGEDGVYVAGVAMYSGERATDIVLQKYGWDGSLAWERVLAAPGYQEPASMALRGGRIYIAGITAPYGSSEIVDGLLVVADKDGNEVKRLAWGGEGRDFFKGVEADDSGVYICGFTDSYGEGDLDGLLLKVDQSGAVVWWRTFGGAGDDSYIDLSLYGGRIHVVGHVTTGGEMLPAYMQYGLDGALLSNWTLAVGSSSWTGVYPAGGAIHVVGNSMRGLFQVSGIYASYVTSYLLTVNLPEDGLWASLDGENKTGRSVSFETGGVEHRLEVTPYKGGEETRLVFTAWSDGVTSNPRTVRLEGDTVLSALYRREHHVTVASEFGRTSGEGWYAEGSTATVSVSPSVITVDLLTSRVFDGWLEDGRRVSPSAVYSFNVTGPVHLVASWRTELNVLALLMLLLVLTAALLALVALLVLSAKRRRKRQPPPPPQAIG